MHTDRISKWQHTHVFGQDQVRSGERRTLIVVVMTGLMMVAEILVGIFFGSMALLADGIHMGSHMVGLLIALIAYVYARKYASDDQFSFGTGKVNFLAGYTSAILLALFSLVMAWESLVRLFNPVEIHYNVAIAVAVIGLFVNGASMLILGENRQSEGEHEHENELHDAHHSKHDHNLRAAYLHVLTDAMTSVFAILALLAAKYFGWNWADPVMGMVGAFLVVHWSAGLTKNSSRMLLDHQISPDKRDKIISRVEGYQDTRISDLHIWSIGPGIFAANISVVTAFPAAPEVYKTLIPKDAGIVHVTVEVHHCTD